LRCGLFHIYCTSWTYACCRLEYIVRDHCTVHVCAWSWHGCLGHPLCMSAVSYFHWLCNLCINVSLPTTLSLHPFYGFSRTAQLSWYQKDKTSPDLNEARDSGVLGSSGINWTICKQSAPGSRQIMAPTPHHSIFTGRMLFWQAAVSKHHIMGKVMRLAVSVCLSIHLFPL